MDTEDQKANNEQGLTRPLDDKNVSSDNVQPQVPPPPFVNSFFKSGHMPSFFVILILAIYCVVVAITKRNFPILPTLIFIILAVMLTVAKVHVSKKSHIELSKNPLFIFDGSGALDFSRSPAMRLIVYEDGLEIRTFSLCCFIPYDKMEEIPEKVGFLAWGMSIYSDIPDVPQGIRFISLHQRKIQKIVSEQQRKYLASKQAR